MRAQYPPSFASLWLATSSGVMGYGLNLSSKKTIGLHLAGDVVPQFVGVPLDIHSFIRPIKINLTLI